MRSNPRTPTIAPQVALLTLAGLAALAFAVPTATALCADDGEGGCSAIKQDLLLTVSPCADDASRLCIAPADGDVDVIGIHTGALNLTVRNDLPIAIDFEVLLTARLDDATSDDGSAQRIRADRLAFFGVPAGQSATHEIAIDGNASAVRLQAMSADQRHGERDAEVWQVMYMTGGLSDPDPMPYGNETDDAADLADDSGVADGDEDGKDAPYLGIVALVGVLAAIVGFRRVD